MKAKSTLSIAALGAAALLSGCAGPPHDAADATGTQWIALSSDDPILPTLTPFVQRAHCRVKGPSSSNLMVVRCQYETITIVQHGNLLGFDCRLNGARACYRLMERFAPPTPWRWRG